MPTRDRSLSEVWRALNIAREQLPNGNAEEAARVCRKLARRYKRGPEPYFVLAQAEHARGRPNKAVDAISGACKRAPDALDLHTVHGELCMQAERPSDAAKVYQRMLKKQPVAPALRTRLASALLETGDTDGALTLHAQAVAAAPEEALVHYNYGAALKRAHAFERVIAHYRKAVTLAPDDVDVWFSLGTLLLETSDFKSGCEQLEAVTRANPNAAPAWGTLP